ncbi:MAG: hypothetical protein M1483_00670 [Actinobacteria bacterium]|nr:hypothetical protein [Actinomycetota bacterium]MCL6104147.1 hypothetical protein [Actinomycetota bacterium]
MAAFNSYTFPKTWSKQGAPNSNTPYDNQVDACVASAANLPAPTAAVSSYAFGISPTVSQGSLSAIKGYHVNSWVTFFPDSTDGLNFLAAVSQGKLIPCFRRLNSQLTLVVHPLPPLTLPSVGDKTASYTFVADVQPPTSKSTPTSKSAPSAYSVGVDVVSFAKGNLVTCIIAIQITGSPINKVTLPGNMLDNLLTSTSAGA